MVRLGLVGLILVLGIVNASAQEPTAERRVAQGPGRNGKKHIFEHFLPFVERLKRCHLWLGGFQFSTLDLSQNVTKLLGGWEKDLLDKTGQSNWFLTSLEKSGRSIMGWD